MMLRGLLSFLWLFAVPSLSEDTALDKPFSANLAKLSHAPCVTLYYRYGRMGCGTADRDLQVGQLQYFDGNLPNAEEPYVAVVEDYMLTAASISTLMAAKGNLQGILVLNSTSNNGNNDGQQQNDYSYYSPDSQTPQGKERKIGKSVSM